MSVDSAKAIGPISLRLINALGVAQGLALVAFPAASTIFTSPSGYGFSATRYGLMFLPQVVLAILGSSIAPRIAQRWSLRRVLLAGLSADITAMILLALSELVRDQPGIAFSVLLVATGALGFGFGTAVMALNTFAEKLSPGHENRAVLTLNALLGTGTALAPALVSLFMRFGVWWMLPICVAVLLAGLLLTTLRAPSPVRSVPEVSAAKDLRRSHKLPVMLWMYAIVVFLYGIVETLNANWATLYLTLQRGVSPQAASWALTAFWALVTAGRLLFAALSSRISVRSIYVGLPLLSAVAFQVVSRANTALTGVVAFGLAGLAASAFLPLSISFAGNAFPSLAAVMSGELIAFYQLGYGVAAFGSGPLRDSVGLSFSQIFSGASALAVAMGVLALVIARHIHDKVSG